MGAVTRAAQVVIDEMLRVSRASGNEAAFSVNRQGNRVTPVTEGERDALEPTEAQLRDLGRGGEFYHTHPSGEALGGVLSLSDMMVATYREPGRPFGGMNALATGSESASRGQFRRPLNLRDEGEMLETLSFSLDETVDRIRQRATVRREGALETELSESKLFDLALLNSLKAKGIINFDPQLTAADEAFVARNADALRVAEEEFGRTLDAMPFSRERIAQLIGRVTVGATAAAAAGGGAALLASGEAEAMGSRKALRALTESNGTARLLDNLPQQQRESIATAVDEIVAHTLETGNEAGFLIDPRTGIPTRVVYGTPESVNPAEGTTSLRTIMGGDMVHTHPQTRRSSYLNATLSAPDLESAVPFLPWGRRGSVVAIDPLTRSSTIASVRRTPQLRSLRSWGILPPNREGLFSQAETAAHGAMNDLPVVIRGGGDSDVSGLAKFAMLEELNSRGWIEFHAYFTTEQLSYIDRNQEVIRYARERIGVALDAAPITVDAVARLAARAGVPLAAGAIVSAGLSGEADAQSQELTPEEAEEAAAARHLMEQMAAMRPPADDVAAATERRASDESGEGGEGNVLTRTLDRTADSAMESSNPQVRGAGLALRYGPAIANDLRKAAWEFTLDPTDNQTLGVLRDATDEILSFADIVGEGIGDLTNFDPRITFIDPETGRFKLGATLTPADRDAFRQALGDESAGRMGGQLPEVAPGEAVTSNVVRPIATFLAVMAATRRAVPGLKAKPPTGLVSGLGEAGKTALAAAGADQVINWEEGLANFIDELVDVGEDGLARDIVNFMRYDEDTPELERRMKIALEGAGFGLITDLVPSFIRNIRRTRGARLALDESMRGAEEGAEGATRDAAETTGRELRASEVEGARQAVADQAERDIINVLGNPADELITKAARAGIEGADPELEARALGGLRVPVTDDTDFVVNLARLETTDDVKGVIRQMVDAHPEAVDEARRGVRSHEATEAAAHEIDAFDVLVSRRVGQALNAEEITAARQLKVAAAEKLRSLAIKAQAGSEADVFAFQRMRSVYAGIMLELQGAQAEAGRALNAFKIQAGGSRELVGQIDELLVESGGLGTAKAMAGRLASLDPSMAREFDKLVETSRFVQGLRAIEEWWLNGLLQNPTTHVVNAGSNTATFLLSVGERVVLTRAAKLIGRPDLAEMGEAAAMIFGVKNSLHDAMRFAVKAARTGQSGFGMQKIEAGRTPEMAKMLRQLGAPGGLSEIAGILNTLSFRGLSGADEFFKTINHRAELYAQAFRRAKAEVRAGILSEEGASARMAEIVDEAISGARQWEDLRIAARNAAQEYTFTKPPRKGGVTEVILQLRGRIPIGGKVIFAFVNTPSNLMKYAWARSPLAPLMHEYQQALGAGGRDALIANTRLAAGTAIVAMIADFVNAESEDGYPIITGGGPVNRSQLHAHLRAQWQPYSIRVGDRYFSYRRTDPIGMTLGMVADLNEIVQNADPDMIGVDEPDEWIAAVAASIGASIMDKSYMTGMADTMDVISDPKRYASSLIDRTGATFLTGNLTPTFRRWNDQNMRYTANMWDEIKNRLPGFSSTLPPRRDLWGREMLYESGLGKVYDAFSPIYARKLDPEPIDLEIINEQYTRIANPARSISFGSGTESVSLRNDFDVWERIQRRAGEVRLVRRRTLLELMNSIVLPPEEGGDRTLHRQYMRFEPGPDGGREEFLNGFIRQYYARARQEVAREMREANHPLVDDARRAWLKRHAPSRRQPDAQRETRQPAFQVQ